MDSTMKIVLPQVLAESVCFVCNPSVGCRKALMELSVGQWLAMEIILGKEIFINYTHPDRYASPFQGKHCNHKKDVQGAWLRVLALPDSLIPMSGPRYTELERLRQYVRWL